MGKLLLYWKEWGGPLLMGREQSTEQGKQFSKTEKS